MKKQKNPNVLTLKESRAIIKSNVKQMKEWEKKKRRKVEPKDYTTVMKNPENVLESGIEIKAAPPGKIIKSLMQLSGGEQAFIGVALFIAILQVNPTPFCILDEIEAALDEVNVERLAQYIKRYSHGTQFIMITHRRGTMAAADRLYGVTMPEHGISKVLMLDINDISKREGEEWNGIFG